MSTAIDITERVKTAHICLMKGFTYTETVHILVKQYNVNDRTAKRYIEDARANYYKTDESLLDDVQLDLARADHLYRKAQEQSDKTPLEAVHTCIKILSTKNDLRKEYKKHARPSIEGQSLSNTLQSALFAISPTEPVAPEGPTDSE